MKNLHNNKTHRIVHPVILNEYYHMSTNVNIYQIILINPYPEKRWKLNKGNLCKDTLNYPGF